MMLPPPCLTVATVQAGKFPSPHLVALTLADLDVIGSWILFDHIILALCVCLCPVRVIPSPQTHVSFISASQLSIAFASQAQFETMFQKPPI